MHSNDLVVQFVVAVRVRQKGVAVRDEQVEDVDDLTSKYTQNYSQQLYLGNQQDSKFLNVL